MGTKPNNRILDIIALLAAFVTGLVLFFGLPQSLRCRWYSAEELADIPSVTAETEYKDRSGEAPLVRVTVRNNSDIDYEYLSHVTHAEQFKDGRWMYWTETPLERRSCTLLYHGLPAGETASYELALNDWLPMPLEPGEYRVWLAYAPATYALTDALSESPNAAGRVCAYFSVEESII